MKDAASSIILSCEHAGNRVPARYKNLFASTPEILTTHRAYDIGIQAAAVRLQKRLNCPLCQYRWTRLLIDANRTQPRFLFSAYSRSLPKTERQRLIDAYHRPYRNQLEQTVQDCGTSGQVIHFSLHSFTPVLNGQVRNADIGILYDPSRVREKTLAVRLQRILRERTHLRVRRNYPYSGRADGMTAWLRRRFSPRRYLGIELELNQTLMTGTARQCHAVQSHIWASIAVVVSPH